MEHATGAILSMTGVVLTGMLSLILFSLRDLHTRITEISEKLDSKVDTRYCDNLRSDHTKDLCSVHPECSANVRHLAKQLRTHKHVNDAVVITE